MADVRVGLVGLGWFGRLHLQAWSAVPGAEVVVVHDADPATLAGTSGAPQDDFHVVSGGTAPVLPTGVAVAGSLDEVLRAGIDVLDVVTPETTHAAIARQALEAGVSVIVEKPLATSPVEARALVELAEAHDAHIYPAHVLRFDPRHVSAAGLLRGRRLHHLSLRRIFQPAALRVYGRVHPLHTAMIHDLDILAWLAGERPASVTAFGTNGPGSVHPVAVDVVAEWSSGLRAVVHNSWQLAPSCPYGFEAELKVLAEGATVTVRNEPGIHVWDEDGVTHPDVDLWPHDGQQRRGALRDELEHFARCVAEHRPSDRVPAADAVVALDIADAALRSLERGGERTTVGAA